MKKLRLLFLIILMITICGCQKEDPVKSPEEIPAEGEPMEITAFSFTHTGMSTDQCFLYSAVQTKEGVRLYTEELFSGGLIVNTIVEEPVLEQLGEIAGRYHLEQWDGFDKTNKHVKDGNRFHLSLVLADESTVSASGSNSFPEGYTEAKRELCELFEKLIDKYGN